MKLLTVGNPKTLKGESRGYLTGILHLSPDDTAGAFFPELLGRTVCAASGNCRALCLNTAGRGGIPPSGRRSRFAVTPDGLLLPRNPIQLARARRTRLYWSDRPAFLAALVEDLYELAALADSHSLRPCARLNGTSDLPAIPLSAPVQDASRALGIRLYDYTKLPRPWTRSSPSYHLTYSLDGPDRLELARASLAHGINVAVVFATPKHAPLPRTFLAHPVLDGDTSDLRFLDPSPRIVGLRAKGRARRSPSPFVFPS